MWFYTRMTYRELQIHQGGEKRTNQIPRIWLAVVSKPIEISCQFKRHWISPCDSTQEWSIGNSQYTKGEKSEPIKSLAIWLAVVSKPIEISCQFKRHWIPHVILHKNDLSGTPNTPRGRKANQSKTLDFDWLQFLTNWDIVSIQVALDSPCDSTQEWPIRTTENTEEDRSKPIKKINFVLL